jgi:hypothetical protein
MEPNINILANLNKYVKEELASESIPLDSKYVLIGTVDNNGAKVIAAVNIRNTDKINTKIAAIWEHDWDGDDTVGMKVIFVGK